MQNSTVQQNLYPQTSIPQYGAGGDMTHDVNWQLKQGTSGSELHSAPVIKSPLNNNLVNPVVVPSTVTPSHTFENAGANAGAKLDTAKAVAENKVEEVKEVAAEKTSEAVNVASQKVVETKNVAANAWETAKEVTTEKVNQTKEMTATALENTKEYLVETKDYVKEIITDTALAAKEFVEEKLVVAAEYVAETAENFKDKIEGNHPGSIPTKDQTNPKHDPSKPLADTSVGGGQGEVDYSSQIKKFQAEPANPHFNPNTPIYSHPNQVE